ncbi:hypothetical protein MAM1_0094c05015 [Mucor ambiguus]|uniref:Uncharacterized protein n=1 Tax=Mucor ambiguus TaxID=91626 RepID=A0A0C9MDX9_9FUNG|nr:hypothetical protein MAM1_0094c05015 [Mucor ambiguus]
MEPLYDQLLQQKFASSTDAFEFCREACQEYGFPIKQETNSNRSIYIYCAHDNPLSTDAPQQQQQQTPPLRKRPSSLKNAAAQECKWRVVLTENELTNEWTFRKSLSPQALEHSHLLSDNEPSIWPQEVYNRIVQLARQKNMQTDEIRDTIKLQFPDITWNDRRFSNCLVQERKRMRQKGVTDKVQRLVMASTRLCSVVAANEDWASCVEGELFKMLENYKHLSRIPNQQMVDSMVDLQLDMIHSEIDKTRRPSAKQQHQDSDMSGKKRRASAAAALCNEGIQVMSVPSCTLYIRSQPLRSLSEPSSQNRRAFTDLIAASSGSAIPQQHYQQQHHRHLQQQQQHQHQQQQHRQQHRHHHSQQQQHHPHHHQQLPFGVSTVFTMTSPVSSPSSTSSLQQRVDYNSYRNSGNNDMLQSPPMPDSTNMIMSSGYNAGSDAYTPHPSTPSSNYNGSAAAAAVAAATGDINFNFDPTAMTNTTPSYPQHVPASPAPLVVHRQQQQQQQQPTTERMAGYPTSMGYYSNSSSSMVREASPSTTSIQQRIMLQQEYEQHQRHLQQMESSSAAAVAAAAVANVHLPLIRSNSPLNATIVQHQHHQQQAHPGSNLNPNHPQNWS